MVRACLECPRLISLSFYMCLSAPPSGLFYFYKYGVEGHLMPSLKLNAFSQTSALHNLCKSQQFVV